MQQRKVDLLVASAGPTGNDGEVRMIAARYLCSIASTARIVGK
jgi:hypothetical protein